MSRVSAGGVPFVSVILVFLAISAIVLASGGDLGTLAQIFNFGTLVTFFFINLSLVKLRWDDPGAKRGFTVPLYPLTPVLGVISCALLIAYLSRYALVFGVLWIAIGLLIFELNIRHFKEIEVLEKKLELHSEKRPEKKE